MTVTTVSGILAEALKSGHSTFPAIHSWPQRLLSSLKSQQQGDNRICGHARLPDKKSPDSFNCHSCWNIRQGPYCDVCLSSKWLQTQTPPQTDSTQPKKNSYMLHGRVNTCTGLWLKKSSHMQGFTINPHPNVAEPLWRTDQNGNIKNFAWSQYAADLFPQNRLLCTQANKNIYIDIFMYIWMISWSILWW